MLPRLPYLPTRHARFQPLLLAAVALGSIGYGWATDNRGFVIIGSVALVGAVLGFLASRVAPPPDVPDDPAPTPDARDS